MSFCGIASPIPIPITLRRDRAAVSSTDGPVATPMRPQTPPYRSDFTASATTVGTPVVSKAKSAPPVALVIAPATSSLLPRRT
jgi:hypothetical protein